jgi:hypothetical protein
MELLLNAVVDTLLELHRVAVRDHHDRLVQLIAIRRLPYKKNEESQTQKKKLRKSVLYTEEMRHLCRFVQ